MSTEIRSRSGAGAGYALALGIIAAACACSEDRGHARDAGMFGAIDDRTVRLRDGGRASDAGDAGVDGGAQPQEPGSAGMRGDPSRAGTGGKPSAPRAGSGGGAGTSGASGMRAQSGAGGMGAQGGAGDGAAASGGGPAAGSGGAAAEVPCEERHRDPIFCDDFEANVLEGWTLYMEGSDGRTELSRTTVHAGGGALDSVKTEPGSGTPIYRDVLGQLRQGHLYLRAYVRVPSSTVIAPAGSRASLLVIGESSGALGGISFVLWNDAVSLQINGPVVSELKAIHALPRDRWLCVQIDFEIGQSAMVRLRIGDTTLAEGVRDTRLSTAYERLWVGVNWIPPEQSGDVRAYYDDLVVDTLPIACE